MPLYYILPLVLEYDDGGVHRLIHCGKPGPGSPDTRLNSWADIMVSLLGGNSEHVAHALRKIGLFREIRFMTALELNTCLKQIKYNRDCSLRARIFLSYHLI